jgi:hypothetical protein
MHPAIIAIALGTQLVVQVSDHIPNYHVERTCQVLKERGEGSDQSYKDCLSDEKSAQQQLGPIWSSYSAALRAQCVGDTSVLGMNSYLDLIVCLQMTDKAESNPGTGTKPATGKRSPN